MSFSLDTLTEGIKARNVGQGNRRLLEKWGRTGLLRGMEGTHRENMATLLENQAGQALRESSSLGGGTATASDIRGFTNIAFPIVRRVFGSLIANELVSIQPMSLPSGLLFYLDYTYGTGVGGDFDVATESSYDQGESIYGQPVNPGKNGAAEARGGMYDLIGSGYSRKHKEKAVVAISAQGTAAVLGAHGAANGSFVLHADGAVATALSTSSQKDMDLIKSDQVLKDLIDGGASFSALFLPWATSHFDAATDTRALEQVALAGNAAAGVDALPSGTGQAGQGILNVRRLTRLVTFDSTALGTAPVDAALDTALGTANTHIMVIVATTGAVADVSAGRINSVSAVVSAGTNEDDLSTVVSPAFESGMQDNAGSDIPEIDIKIESVSVVAQTRKLRAKWSPELAQDLNAYHSLDAEVELTQILSEQVALEIDREILGDLIQEAGAANFFWSRSPGNFVNKRTGAAISRASSLRPGPAFTGTVREWYETLVETIIDVSNEIHRKTLRGAGNFIVVSPEVATVLEASVLYKPALTLDGDGQVASPMTLGAEKVGTLSSRFTVYKDPYFPRHKILVGFKGSSYLETGYVYAPYVPLIVTPTIFAPEDFTPRKGVMTRYGKKMVRNDFYGTVTCLDMNII